MRILAVTGVALLVAAAPALAQPKPKLEDRVNELSQRVDEAMKSAAESASAMKSLQVLQREVTDVKAELERQRGAQLGLKETRGEIEGLQRRVENLELQVRAIGLPSAQHVDIAGFDEGFFLRSPDRRFLLRAGTLLQAAYVGTIYGAGGIYADGVLGKNTSTFQLRRAALDLDGHIFAPRFAYHVELDFGSVDPGPLVEAYGEVLAHRLANLRAGKMKVPMGRQFLIHSRYQSFVERSGATEAFVPGWDLGVELYGSVELVGLLSYQVGIFNGDGPRVGENQNLDFLYAARVVYEPFGHIPEAEGALEPSRFLLAIGASFAYNLVPTDILQRRSVTDPQAAKALLDRDGDGRVDNVATYNLGLELDARYRRMAWQSEFFYRHEDPGNIGSDRNLWGSYWGVYSQFGIYPTRWPLEVAARYGYWEPADYGVSRADRYRPTRVHELAAVATLLAWKQLLKWQLEYDHQWQQDLAWLGHPVVSKADVNLVWLQAQLAF